MKTVLCYRSICSVEPTAWTLPVNSTCWHMAALFLSSWLGATPWLTTPVACCARYMPSQTHRWRSEPLYCTSSEAAPKKNMLLLCEKREAISKFEKAHAARPEQWELQCKSIAIKTTQLNSSQRNCLVAKCFWLSWLHQWSKFNAVILEKNNMDKSQSQWSRSYCTDLDHLSVVCLQCL